MQQGTTPTRPAPSRPARLHRPASALAGDSAARRRAEQGRGRRQILRLGQEDALAVALISRKNIANPGAPPPFVLIGHAASLTPY